MARNARNPDIEPDESVPVATTLHERIGEWLAADDWRYGEGDDGSWYSMSVSLEAGTARIIIDSSEEEGRSQLIVICIFPVNIPQGRRHAVAEFLTRLNYVTRLGVLEMDWVYGEVRQRIAVDLVDMAVNQPTFDRMLRRTMQMANRAFAPLLSVGFGEVAPEIAFAALQASVEKERSEREGAVLQ